MPVQESTPRPGPSAAPAGVVSAPGTAPSVTPSEGESKRPRSWLGRLVHGLTADAHTLDAEELESTAIRTGAECCRDVRQGDSVRMVGRLRSVVYTPNDTLPTLEAELFDGTGSLTLVWLGQRHIVGIEPGRQVAVVGRITRRNGERTMYNPWYELLSTTA